MVCVCCMFRLFSFSFLLFLFILEQGVFSIFARHRTPKISRFFFSPDHVFSNFRRLSWNCSCLFAMSPLKMSSQHTFGLSNFVCCEDIFNDDIAQKQPRNSTKDLGNWRKNKKRVGRQKKKREIFGPHPHRLHPDHLQRGRSHLDHSTGTAPTRPPPTRTALHPDLPHTQAPLFPEGRERADVTLRSARSLARGSKRASERATLGSQCIRADGNALASGFPSLAGSSTPSLSHLAEGSDLWNL